jgi:16S rRNA U516 pseudouridylate synthase RsuA-like enzyme
MAKKKPGRPRRAAALADQMVKLRLTKAERRKVRRLAQQNGCSVADLIRMALLTFVADLDDGDNPPVILAGRLSVFHIVRAPSTRFVAR